MIRKMKKLSLFVFHEDKSDTLEKISSLGIIHVDIKSGITNSALDDIYFKRNTYLKAKSILENSIVKNEKNNLKIKDTCDSNNNIDNKIDNVINISERIDKLYADIEVLNKELAIVSPYGDFDFEKIEKIKKYTGYNTYFYVAQSKTFEAFDFTSFENISVHKISESMGKVYFVIFKLGDDVLNIPFDIVHLSDKSLHNINKSILDIKKVIDNEEKTLLSYVSILSSIEKSIKSFNINVYFEEACESFEETGNTDGKIYVITTFIPKNKLVTTKHFLNENKIAYVLEEPSLDDSVPVEFKNNKYSSPFEMITRLFMLPSYFELDLTPMIAVFYPIFFAYCFGDSGYGIVLTIISIIMLIKFKGNLIQVGLLTLTLGILTTIMGVINSGVIFGVDIISLKSIPFFNFLSNFIFITDKKKDWLFTPFNTALLCGVFQIIFALMINIMNKIRFGNIGDIFAAIGKFLLVPSLILWFLGDMQKMELVQKYIYPYYYITIILGLIFLSILSNIGKKIDVLNSLLGIYFAITGLLGDILSYIRLFALGTSSAILGLVVNQISSNFMGIPIIGVFIMIIFLIVGHTGNFLLSMLGSLVHPLRLTFVEFYNNAGFVGGGKEYKPLKKEI